MLIVSKYRLIHIWVNDKRAKKTLHSSLISLDYTLANYRIY